MFELRNDRPARSDALFPLALFIIQVAAGSRSTSMVVSPGEIAEIKSRGTFKITSAANCISKLDEIVVCASRDQHLRYRARPLPPGYESQNKQAETQLGAGAVGAIAVEAADLGNGIKSNRLMVRIKTKF